MSLRPTSLAAALAAMTMALAPAAHAQSIWLDRTSAKSIHLEIAKPLYEQDETDFWTANGSLSGRFPIGTRLHFVGELPYARLGSVDLSYGTDDTIGGYDFGETSSTIGNLYVGIETDPVRGGGSWFEAGLRLPTASDDEVVTTTATFVDTDRWEAYALATEPFVVHTAGHWRSNSERELGADLRVATNLWCAGNLYDDVELFFVYGGQLLYRDAVLRAGAGVTGRWLTSGPVEGNTTYQFEAAADVLAGQVRPGMTLRIPLGDDQAIRTDAVIGVTLGIVLD